ncbi:transcriptional regulator, HxlR family [Filimonas lacunae]|uniref:Transcriptional regulator, HxlR family n=1 Tax=Filimonas lacunae TaxID=477680 RepID=A0A173MIS8_9BACT|nr:helix-turn-helix domain-containing protein [Filimonas lacunae]BAV07308.1 transcriptional regulator, HxlR family [Filimonas lacunae]SIS91615.1 transcriptional regulator, HxlR family [Filimonas lacunae]
MAKLSTLWYNFVTGIIHVIKMSSTKREKLAKEVLGHPRDPKAEVQALQDAIYVIGGKWKLPIINSICNGNKRFREIERSIPGITTRMLSRELKEMELNQLILRTVSDLNPASVEYTATDYCYSFADIILAMIKWGKDHQKRIKGR